MSEKLIADICRIYDCKLVDKASAGLYKFEIGIEYFGDLRVITPGRNRAKISDVSVQDFTWLQEHKPLSWEKDPISLENICIRLNPLYCIYGEPVALTPTVDRTTLAHYRFYNKLQVEKFKRGIAEYVKKQDFGERKQYLQPIEIVKTDGEYVTTVQLKDGYPAKRVTVIYDGDAMPAINDKKHCEKRPLPSGPYSEFGDAEHRVETGLSKVEYILKSEAYESPYYNGVRIQAFYKMILNEIARGKGNIRG